ncbi:MAG TPA: hypothetical protein VKU39_05210 [Streptosporangiaceae bacterium]|nr:hypothetical protein [Streptosporangiaceae bacterium]
MSFSFSASGTKDQALRQLGDLVHQHDSHSKQTTDLVISMVEAAPSQMTDKDGKVFDASYAISAYGHSSAGHDLPSLGVSFSCTWKEREQQDAVEAAEPGHAGE